MGICKSTLIISIIRAADFCFPNSFLSLVLLGACPCDTCVINVRVYKEEVNVS